MDKNGISQQDILDCIQKGNSERSFSSPMPDITWDKIQKFHEDEANYMTHAI